MPYPSCISLVNLAASCDAVKKVGGITSAVYLAPRKVLKDNRPLSFPFLEWGLYNGVDHAWRLHYDSNEIIGNELAKFEGIELKNTGGFEVAAGENVNAFTHNLTMVLFHYTQAQLKKLELLLQAEDLIAIVLTNSGDIKVYGAEKGKTYSPEGVNLLTSKRGLQPLTGTGADIVELQGEVGVSIQLSSTNMLNMPYMLGSVYNIGNTTNYNTFAQMQSVLDQLSANNV
jgi:hypothetical protein